MSRTIQLVIAGLLLGSCRSVEIPEITQRKFQCEKLDWFEIGRNDGVLGFTSDSLASKSTGCENFSDRNKEQYINGWYAGVDEYCTKDQGFAFGRSGGEYKKICPATKEKAFLSGYSKGRQVFLYEKDNQSLRIELQEVSQKANSAKDEVDLSALQKQLAELETRLELNRALIAEIQKEVTDTDSQSQTF